MYRKIVMAVLLISMLMLGVSPSRVEGKANVGEESKVQPMVVADFGYSLILKEDGTVWGCGVNKDAELGNGEITETSGLKQVAGLTDIVKVDAANFYSMALRKGGTVWGWGSPYFNELGLGKPWGCYYASQITEFKDAVDIAVGNGYSFALKKDGTVWYMGGSSKKITDARKMEGLNDIVDIAAKHTRVIALKKDGTVYTLEWEYADQKDEHLCKLGKPSEVLTGVKKIEMGCFQYLAIKKDGSLWCWGENTHGELGNGSLSVSSKPRKIEGLNKVKEIGAGYYYSMAILNDGSYLAWGDNQDGQYGNGTKQSSLKPVKVSGMTDIVTMSGGYNHTIALKKNGDVIVTGFISFKNFKQFLKPFKVMNTGTKSKEADTILPNGDLADWKGTEPLAVGEDPKDLSNREGIREFYAMKDSRYLYLAAALTVKSPKMVSFDLDFDGDGTTDYSLIYNTEDGTHLFLFQKKGKSMKWIGDGFGVYGTVVETRIKLSDLGNPKKIMAKASIPRDDGYKYRQVWNYCEVPER